MLAYVGPAHAKWRPGSDANHAFNDLQFCTNGGRFHFAGDQEGSIETDFFAAEPTFGGTIVDLGLALPFNPIDFEIAPEDANGLDTHWHRDYSATFTVRWKGFPPDPGSSVETNFGPVLIKDCIFSPIEIQPGRSNVVRPRSRGRIEVAILASAFAASDVRVSAVRFGGFGDEAKPVGKRRFRDVNGDRRKDLVLNFKIKDVKILCSSTDAAVTGRTSAGQEFVGSDAIRTRGCH